jgi:hypothetical protein
LGLLLPPSFVLGLLLPPYFRDYYYPPILGIIPPPRYLTLLYRHLENVLPLNLQL